jgi:NAD(P)-dependent dehydrogenase (short-subunit alcohol dehydrogenase family)
MVAKAHFDDHEALDAVVEELAERSPIKGRAGMPADVAYAALYLASDESGNTSGHCLVLDGGLTTGSSAKPPHYSERQPFLAEGGRTEI